ncbi:MAG: GNAT family N-acetyltransferase [Methylococcus sp.]|nr:GNAT family N-acetyltransferase [Methylococcus sp.]
MTSSHISYRAALKSDAREMVNVHFAAIHAINSDYYSSDVKFAWSPPPDAARQEWLSDLISQDSMICVVAVFDHNTIIGFCVALPSEAQLKALYVHPEHSGSGIGHALLQCIESRCRAIGLEALELKASRNAESFYRHSGYDVVGSTTQQLTDTVSMEAIRMRKRFSQVIQPCAQPDLAHKAAQGR